MKFLCYLKLILSTALTAGALGVLIVGIASLVNDVSFGTQFTNWFM